LPGAARESEEGSATSAGQSALKARALPLPYSLPD
jgi:hypothetical protein